MAKDAKKNKSAGACVKISGRYLISITSYEGQKYGHIHDKKKKKFLSFDLKNIKKLRKALPIAISKMQSSTETDSSSNSSESESDMN